MSDWKDSKECNPIKELKEAKVVAEKVVREREHRAQGITSLFSFEELMIFLKSRNNKIEQESLGCFIVNYGDIKMCRDCKGLQSCDEMNGELERIDNLRTVAEIEEAIGPVIKYRREQEQKIVVNKNRKADYSATCDLNGGDGELQIVKDGENRR